jgi:diguanylate cyclase (GGDEF)-like protein
MRVVASEWEGKPASLALLRDVTERRRMEDELGYLATHDELTGLPNRYLLGDRLSQAVARLRHSGQALAMVFADLDGFKAINDRMGHPAGDQVLVETARRILSVVRAADTVARIGGDEFLVICEVADQATADAVVARLTQAINQPLVLGDQTVMVRASIGMVLEPHPDPDPASLLAAADDAMYREKRRAPASQRAR